MTRDITSKQFIAACKRHGFVRRALGYYELSGTSVQVNIYNAGKRRRDWLTYLIAQQKLYERKASP